MVDVRACIIPRLCLSLLCLVLAATGCAQLNAGHLQRKPWETGVTQNIHSKFFSFDFESIPLASQYGVKGTAHPIRENLPPWVDGVDNLSLTAYLCDSQGRVLAKDKKYYLPQRVTEAGIPFDFFLNLKPGQSQDIYISFGYRATFVADKYPKSPGAGQSTPTGQRIFFSSEDAVYSH
jgi:hypothetical protein